MSHGVRRFVWRNGRPRWVPPRNLRELGFKGKDLKDTRGEWMTLPVALVEAEELNKTADVALWSNGKRANKQRKKQYSPPLNAHGYVYFIWTDGMVKIGYSKDPFSRMKQLKVSLSTLPEKFCVIRGTQAGEKRLHTRLAKYRSRGEWFLSVDHVNDLLMAMVEEGNVNLP